ncbi:WD repeat-containing protein 34-like isoform X2 [Anoplophora glabripennis]|uniref:WD repeat-containing protein 34-like isoform X2 n=1 Tax=Anoplophora glabripennis TaxID=217634 RepID=UPI00087510BB|nr:WD repeat-containing protein 34-like isoform X2 [Anoplophora glabripennis]
MFGIKHNECVGFESKWKVKKVSSETSTQTTEFGVAEKGTSTQGKISTEVQTVADETVLKKSSEADMEKLAHWLSKIYPSVKKEIDNANNSRAFRGYRLAKDRNDANCKLLQNLNVFKSGESGDKATRVSALTWNRTGKTIAITCNYEHTSWCYHLGEVFIYTLNRDERLPDVPRTKLSTESCVMSLKFHPVHPAILAAGTFAGGIIIWNIQNDEGDDVVTTASAHEEMVTQLSWITDINSSKSIILASSSTDGLLKLWTFNAANATLTVKAKYKVKPPILGNVHRNVETPEHVEKKGGRGVVCFDFSRHVADLFVVGIEGGLMVQCSVLGATPLKGNTKEEPLLDPAFKYYEPHEGEITSVSISPNRNDMFMTSGTDAEIRIYLFGQEEPAQVIFMRNPLNDLMFVPHEDKLVVGCGSNGIMEIFHLITGRAVENVTKEKYVMFSVIQFVEIIFF